MNVNISNEFNLTDVCRNINYIGWRAKFTLQATRCSLLFDNAQKNEIRSFIAAINLHIELFITIVDIYVSHTCMFIDSDALPIY